MAASSSSPIHPPVRVELPSTPVQELIKSTNNTTNQIPDIYVFRDSKSDSNNNNGSDDDDVPWMESVIIDLQLLLNDDDVPDYGAAKQQELLKLRHALTSWGSIQLVNHGIASSLLDQLQHVGKEFFALPLEEKQKCCRTADWFEGYGCDGASQGQALNWNDRLHLRIHPVHTRNLNLWPDNVPNFRETLDKYSTEMKRLIDIMLKAIAKSLDLKENVFLDQFGEDGTFFARFNYYPPCPHPDRVVGLKPHADGTVITILLQDNDVDGLQFLKDDQWYKVPVIPHALVINVGNQLEIMSNGILKSPVHKAVIDKEKARMSIAVPSSVSIDKEIGPLSELIDIFAALCKK